MPTVRIPKKQRFILDGVSWTRYVRFLRDFSDRNIRLTYDRGILEVMTISHEHDHLGEFLDLLILILARECKLPFHLGGSTTLRRRKKKRGIEPDKCYWFANASLMRGKKKVDLRKDPPPDLGLEVDITHSSLDRMRIYSSLGIPEVWRWDEHGLSFWRLNTSGKYELAGTSGIFPVAITAAEVMKFVEMRDTMNDSEVIDPFTTWVRARIAASQQA